MGVIPLIMLAIYFVIIIVLTLRTPKSGSGNFEDFMTGSKSMGAIVVGPVSYTHLDVYKRQVYHLAKIF